MVVKTNDNNEDEPDIVEESQAVYPYSASEISIDEQIRKISPRFYDIYRQCLIAKMRVCPIYMEWVLEKH